MEIQIILCQGDKMKVSHRISFPGGKEFEQHECIFDLDGSDVEGVAVDKLNSLQKIQLLNTLVVINGLLYQRGEGYIGKEDYDARKKRILSLLAPQVQEAFLEVLNSGNKTGE
jgi:hypothetical protein